MDLHKNLSALMNAKTKEKALSLINRIQDLNASAEDYYEYITDLNTSFEVKKIIFKEMFKNSDCSSLKETMNKVIENGGDTVAIRYGIDRVIENCDNDEILDFEEEVLSYGKKGQKIVLEKIKQDNEDDLNRLINQDANYNIIVNMIGKILSSKSEDYIKEHYNVIKLHGTETQKEKMEKILSTK